VLALTFVPAAALGGPSLALPVRCEIGPACIVQNYVDRAPGPEARDYRCGLLTYDGHKGTDIRVIDAARLAHGVPVLAAAPGRVRAVRDGMRDVSVRAQGKAAIAGREAGNSVVIEHGEGWETQYAHLRKGSVTVRAGDIAEAGQQLGVVGLSGHTEFPHLHFEVRHRGSAVDPFVGLEAGEACNPGDRPLWRDDAIKALAYAATGVLGAGISGAPPVMSDGGVDQHRTSSFTAASGAAVFWVQIYGARAHDVEEFRLIGPHGGVLAQRRGTISRDRAQWLAYVGMRRDRWAAGRYRGEYALYRGSPKEKVISLTREIEISPGVLGR
jgi:hypothetical protein